MRETDFLVIGSGPSGALTAWELKKNNKDVIIIESGSYYNLNSCAPYSTKEMEQKYKYGGLSPTINNPRISYVEGSCAGGGSEINSGFYHRTPKKIISQWANENRIKDFSYSSIAEHFKVIEKEISVSHLPDGIEPARASLKLKEGADKLGWSNLEVPRWFKFDNKNNGTKQSMTETYLKWYMESNGEIIFNSMALKIKNQNKQWIVKYKDTLSGLISIIKTKYLFLCGGAISTPHLLKASGIKKNIGNTLQMHPTVKVVAEFDDVINFHNMGVPVHQVNEFSPQISFGCSISSKQHIALAMLDNKENLNRVNENWEKMAIYYAMIKPRGKGKIIKIPFFNDPIVWFGFHEEDLKLLSKGLSSMCKLLIEAGAKKIFPSIKNFGIIENKSDINLIPNKLPKTKTSLMTIHLFSSCPMGEDRSHCAVNSYGEVFNQNNLYVNDGSILPSAPGVNPQGSIMAIARRNVLHFLKNL